MGKVYSQCSLTLIPEPTNYSVDRNAVTVMKEQIVGHVPFNLFPIISLLLRRDVNNAFARVSGGKVYRGAGYGLEIPCFTDQSLILTSYKKLLIL